MNTYKIKDSLFIVGNKVISYETHVATIKGNKLIENGRYSRTTSKHIRYVASLFGLEIEFSQENKKGTFYKYDFGVKIKIENAISPKGSKIILDMLRNDIPYEIVIAATKNKISKKDWNLLEKPEVINKDLMKGASLLARIDIL